MKKTLAICGVVILFAAGFALIGGAQVVVGNGYLQYVWSAPSGSCGQNAQLEQVVGAGTVYTCQSGTWAQVSGGGSGTITGVTAGTGLSGGGTTGTVTVSVTTPAASGTANQLAIYTGANAVGADPNITDASGLITFGEPIALTGTTHGITIPAGTAVSGSSGNAIYASDATNGYAEVNENNTGLSRLCTAANGICGAPVSSPTPGTSVSLTAPFAIYWCTSTCTVTIPMPPINGTVPNQFCIFNGDNVATVITLAALGSSGLYENQARTGYGTAGTGTVTSGGAVKDSVCYVGVDSTHYNLASSNGTITAH